MSDMEEEKANLSSGTRGMGQVVDRNIHALIDRRRKEDAARNFSGKLADAVTRFAGSMEFVYIHLCIFGIWMVINLGWTPIKAFDPTFVVLAMVASVEAIFLSTFVLITQNRMAALAEQRAELDLQVSLLAEYEITRLIGLVARIGEKVGIDSRNDPELRDLLHDVRPERVLDKIESVTASERKN